MTCSEKSTTFRGIRTLWLFWVTVLLGSALVACQSPVTGAGSPGAGGTPANSILITFPQNTSRSITISTATTYSNFYQVIAYNASHIYYATVTSTGGILSNVATGTYTVIGLAGLKTSGTTNPIVVQLGGASQAGVVVGSTSPTVSLVLTNVLYSIAANPSSPTVNSSVVVTVDMDTGVPTVEPMTAAGTSGGWSQTSTSETATSLISGSNWTTSATFTGPATAQTVSYGLQSGSQGQLALIDAANGYSTATSLYSLTGGATSGVFWYLPSEAATGYSPTYDTSIAPGALSVTFSSPSISVGLTWGSGR